ncbi:hypothetical protein HER32_00250 [Hymenobacter sp. BT18]|uniref:hypothetical protein n=1 Tax=Hymenobacter sp. BT18 TaxID=2835648 RepID=UPI00143EDE13|nr:hypothetical protein [Hymenobacter sp. BT18]QIX59706.1 hypothetical protein HER32_00250 [Hymenobacter sp. BT18]
MPLGKIKFQGLGTKVAGLAAGTAATGFIQKGLTKLGLAGMTSNLALVAIGAVGPDLLGKKNPLLGHAGDAVMVTGINAILREQFPSLIQGLDDNVAGYGDYEVGEADSYNDVDVSGIVSGPDDNVAGTNAL